MHGKKFKWQYMLTFILGVFLLSGSSSYAAEPVELYTTFTNLSVTPGQSVNYSVEVMNNSDQIQTVDLGVQGLPSDWLYELKSGGWNVEELTIKANESNIATITVEVPLAVDKGTYQFQIVSNKARSL